MDSVFLNGTVGAGKSTLAGAISAAEPIPHAVIDLDEIRRLRPSPRSDPFNHELELRNLRSIAANYRVAGARRFVLAGVIEVPGEVDRYLEALGSDGMLVCRVVAEPAVLEARLRERHRDDPVGLDWHLARVGELSGILDRFDRHDLVLESSHTTATDLGAVVRTAAGWDLTPAR